MNDNIEGHFSVSKLVANAFIPNLDNKEYVINIDGNFENNIVENLCWMTAKEHDNFLRLIDRKNSNGSKQAIIATKGKEILEFDSNKSASSYFNIGEDRLCRNIKSKTKINGWLFQYKNHQKNYIREEKRKLDFSQYDGSNYQLEDLPGEVWKQIEEYPSYLVSNKGRLKNTNYRGRNEEAIVHQFIGKDYAVAYFYLENGRIFI